MGKACVILSNVEILGKATVVCGDTGLWASFDGAQNDIPHSLLITRYPGNLKNPIDPGSGWFQKKIFQTIYNRLQLLLDLQLINHPL